MTDSPNNKEKTTHFGYRNVPESEKARLVGEVFHSVAGKYDLMNDLMSFGIHRLWKRFAIEQCGVRKGSVVLDLAGGTGDLTARLVRQVSAEGRVYLSDINSSMLESGRARSVASTTVTHSISCLYSVAWWPTTKAVIDIWQNPFASIRTRKLSKP
jgi:demethylmenaquinone methyltransferase/2-methoxy-6-polyprenyl-1,4-benzoquinol methylase